MKGSAKELTISVSVRKTRGRPERFEQLSFIDVLFRDEPQKPKRVKHEVRVYRPTPGLLVRYRGLADIPPEKWYRYFPKTGKSWSNADRQYLIEWWGKEDVMSLAYALGRPPWGLQREVSRLRKEGVEIAYMRSDFGREEIISKT